MPHFYSIEEDNWLRDNVIGVDRKTIVERFNKRFNTNITINSLSNRMHKLKIYTGVNCGCFKKGNKPFNVGLKQSDYLTQEQIEKTSKTRFKKGNKPANTRNKGDERIDVDGYTLVKIKDNKWVAKQRLVYEKYHHCKLTKDQKVIFNDGNKNNFDIDNLVLTTTSELARINHEHLRDENNRQITDINLDIIRLNAKTLEIERGKRK